MEEFIVEFKYKNKLYEFEAYKSRDIFGQIVEFLTKNEYNFTGKIHKGETRKLLSESEYQNILKTKSYQSRNFYKLNNQDFYILCNYNAAPIGDFIKKMLLNFDENIEITKFEGFDEENSDESSPTEIKKFGEINPPTPKFQKRDRAEPVKLELKNPFGCKQNNDRPTSALCILGKSGSGKTVTTENALESMGHEYYLYIPIEGEYTFTQYTGTSFELSSIGEFILQAKNDPNKFYTLIFDEAHRPFTINKLNFDLLQALSSERNREGQRFFTMDKITKRMFTNPNPEEFKTGLIESRGKVLVPDNFGIVLLSSNMSIIPRNPDLFNRVDIVLFKKEFRNCEDLTKLQKLKPDQKNEDYIEQFFINEEV